VNYVPNCLLGTTTHTHTHTHTPVAGILMLSVLGTRFDRKFDIVGLLETT